MKREYSFLPALILLIAALALCVYGFVSGEAQTVFMKAATICMECIGLG